MYRRVLTKILGRLVADDTLVAQAAQRGGEFVTEYFICVSVRETGLAWHVVLLLEQCECLVRVYLKMPQLSREDGRANDARTSQDRLTQMRIRVVLQKRGGFQAEFTLKPENVQS
jgi:hypothetical protein